MPNDIKKIIGDLKQSNERIGKFLYEINKRIAELDLKYAQMALEDEIGNLKIAKDILEKKKSAN